MKPIRPIYDTGEDLVTTPTYDTVTTWLDLQALIGTTPEGGLVMMNTGGVDMLYIYKEYVGGVYFNAFLPLSIYNEIDSIAENSTGQCFYNRDEGEVISDITPRGFVTTGCTDVANGIAIENGDDFDFTGILGTSKGYIVYIECYGETGTALNLNRINLQDGQRTTQVCFARSAPNQYGLAFGTSSSGEQILAPADLYTPCIIRTDHDNDAEVTIYGLASNTSRAMQEGVSTTARGFYFNAAAGTQKTTVKKIFVFNKK